MRIQKCSKELYGQFLIAAQKDFSATGLATLAANIHHDSVTRWLRTTRLTPHMLWEQTQVCIQKQTGILVVDDSVLSKQYSQKIGLTKWQYSGNEHKVVKGIDLVTLLWTNSDEHIPIDYRIYAPLTDGKTKNQHFQEMIRLADHRGIQPEVIVFDAWYSSVANLKTLNKLGFTWVTWLRSNRIVDKGENLKDKTIPKEGLVVHLRAVGMIKVFKIVAPKTGDIEYLATNKLTMEKADIERVTVGRWNIEAYHRGIKQVVGVEKCQARNPRSQRTHIFCAILSFVVLERHRLKTGVSWYETKRRIIQNAMRHYFQHPSLSFTFT